MCVDFRDLNKLVVPEPQPYPRIEDIIVTAGSCNWFSTLDVSSAFWSIPLRKDDEEKTAFVTQHGHFQWNRLPSGLKSSPAIIRRVLSSVLKKHLLNSFCVNHIDDILVFSKPFAEHLIHLGQLMEALEHKDFKPKLSKCHLAKRSVKCLGHILGKME